MTALDMVGVLLFASWGAWSVAWALVAILQGAARAHQLRWAREASSDDVRRAHEALPSDAPAWDHRFTRPRYRRDTSTASYSTIEELAGARTVDEP